MYIRFQTKYGTWDIQESADPSYPGLDIEFEQDGIEETKPCTKPRCVIEFPNESCNKMRILIWANPNSEDYTNEILLDNFFVPKEIS